MDWNIIGKIKLPWLPFLYHPHFNYELPRVDLSREEDRIVIFFIFLLVASLLSAGLIYMIVEIPPPLLPANKTGTGFISNQSSLPYFGQTIVEGVLVAILYIIGTIGFFFVRRSNRLLTERYKSVVWFYAGFILVITAIVGLLFLLGQKG